jgi:DNA replicative helicase MCM subunit Mcm2 (Cdc46/Mcm family)
MTDKTFLENLKPGDRVVISSGGVSDRKRVGRVERLTKTQIIVDGSRFRKSDGWQPGDYWNRAWLQEASEETIKEIAARQRRRQIVAKIQKFRWDTLPDDLLQQVVDLLEPGDE